MISPDATYLSHGASGAWKAQSGAPLDIEDWFVVKAFHGHMLMELWGLAHADRRVMLVDDMGQLTDVTAELLAMDKPAPLVKQ